MEQYLGESDKDYEARKKRVKRTRMGIDNSLAHGGTSSVYPTTGVPKVLRSEILPNTPEGIMVTWDRPMMMSCDVKDQIKVIDGDVETAPQSVEFNPSDRTKMGIIMAIPFTPTSVVTWAYDDTGSCDLQQIAVPNTEADNQTYTVSNLLS